MVDDIKYGHRLSSRVDCDPVIVGKMVGGLCWNKDVVEVVSDERRVIEGSHELVG